VAATKKKVTPWSEISPETQKKWLPDEEWIPSQAGSVQGSAVSVGGDHLSRRGNVFHDRSIGVS